MIPIERMINRMILYLNDKLWDEQKEDSFDQYRCTPYKENKATLTQTILFKPTIMIWKVKGTMQLQWQ